LKAKALFDALADNLAKEEAETQDKKLRDVEERTLLDSLADVLAGANAASPNGKLGDMRGETLVETLTNMLTKLFNVKAEDLAHVMADRPRGSGGRDTKREFGEIIG